MLFIYFFRSLVNVPFGRLGVNASLMRVPQKPPKYKKHFPHPRPASQGGTKPSLIQARIAGSLSKSPQP